MKETTEYETTVAKAACRARGDRLNKLYALCENQTTVIAGKLSSLIDELAESDKLDAIHCRCLADQLNNKS